MLPGIEAVWLWLAPAVGPEQQDGEPRAQGPPALKLAAQAGQGFGSPEPMDPLTPDNPLAARCFDGRSVAVDHNLPSKALAWGWPWLAHARVESFVGFPLQIGSAMLGVLGVFTRRTVSAEFISQLHLSVNQLTVALEKARLLGETRRRAEELARANEELRQLDAMKDWFVSSVSHELRTPLTSIRSFGEILENYDDLSPEEGREFASIVRRESERLTDLINDLLDLARMADGELKLKPDAVELADLVERCCQPFARQAGERDMAFSHEMPEGLPGVFADGKAISRVLHNLLSNAFKFTHDGGDIRVSAERASGDGQEMVTVLVTDSGIGIAPKDQPKVFEKFTQVHTGFGDRPAGTGIGLAICREIVEQSGGEIWVESRPGRGSTFAFTLPTAQQRGQA
jgi:signal transduction histidine kinase